MSADITTQESIDMLSEIKGSHTECISLYIPAKRDASDVINYLNKEASQTQNIKDKSNRKQVISGISKLIE